RGWAKGSVEQEIVRDWLTSAFDRTSGSVLALMGRWGATGAFCDSKGGDDYRAAWQRCQTPVLVVAGDRDELADAEHDVRPAYALSGSSDKRFRLFGEATDGAGFGHIDLLIGR